MASNRTFNAFEAAHLVGIAANEDSEAEFSDPDVDLPLSDNENEPINNCIISRSEQKLSCHVF